MLFNAYLPEKNLLVCVAPKSGSRTVSFLLRTADCVRDMTASVHILDEAKDKTGLNIILVWRNPLKRLVSGFFMSEVSPETNFDTFLKKYNDYQSLHQIPQFDQATIDKIPIEGNTIHTMETEDLGSFGEKFSELTGDPPPTGRRLNRHINKRNVVDDYSYDQPIWTISKEDLRKGGIPPWDKFFDAERIEFAKNLLKFDYESLKRFGVDI